MSVAVWTLIIAALTLAAALATLFLMYHDRRSRLHLTVLAETPDPQVELCLIWSVFNPGSKPIRVGQPGLLLPDGRRLPEQNDWSPHQVGLQLGVNYSYVRTWPFELGPGQADRLCRFMRNIVSHLEAEGFDSESVQIRPFVNYGEGSVRYADTWWQVDLKQGHAQPVLAGRLRRSVARMRRAMQ